MQGAPVVDSSIGRPRRAGWQARRRQRGLSLMGLIMLGVLLTFGAMLALKVGPTVLEYLAVKRAVARAFTDGTDPTSIRTAFDRAASIEDITSITGRDLLIAPAPGGGFKVSFAYEKRVLLFGPAYLLLDYQGAAGAGAREAGGDGSRR
jgi:hypothetical protein